MSQTDSRTELRSLGALYEETRERVVNLVREASYVDFFAGSAAVPACPGWRVRDVLAHLNGLATDIAAGNIDGAATSAWTAAQVDARRNVSVGELLAESDEVGPQLACVLDDFPGRYGAQVAADITVHEHDIRGALHQPGARDSAGVAHALAFLLETWVAPAAHALGLPVLHITSGPYEVVVGGGRQQVADATPVIQHALATWTWPPETGTAVNASPSTARLVADPFDVMRALSGRRSLDQVHRLGWTVDPTPYDELFGLWPFTPQPQDLIE